MPQELGPLLGQARVDSAYKIRVAAADRLKAIPNPPHPNNGDEDDPALKGFVANFSKGLPHDGLGEVVPAAYQALLKALGSGKPADFVTIPLGGDRNLVNPQAGLAFDLEGLDPHQFEIPPAPSFSSAEEAAEMVELYWMALLRDCNFADYDSDPTVKKAAAELTSLKDFTGPKQGGKVTPGTLFRDELGGNGNQSSLRGPYISQFFYLHTPFGAETVDRRLRTRVRGRDFMTDFPTWLDVQKGKKPSDPDSNFQKTRVYIRNGRDLSEWVHIDVLFQAYFNACLILGTGPENGGLGCPANPTNPYSTKAYAKQDGFGTWGAPFFKTILCEVATRALKAVWFQKWYVHRRLRPEAFGGRIHVHKTGQKSYPIHKQVLDSKALAQVEKEHKSFLLPMAFPEGSPIHPAYGAGHATVAGACVTLLKALFDESHVIPNPRIPTANGTATVNLSPDPKLTVGGELNKLASNVATGRNHAGVHWRTDATASLRLGEKVAIELLRDTLTVFNEDVPEVTFTGFDGKTVVVKRP